MAHPFFHAISSAKTWGGPWTDYIDVHEWMDQIKAHVPDCRHRIVLHNDWGCWLASQHGVYTTLAWGNGMSGPEQELISNIAYQHVREDMGNRIPTVDECVFEFDRAALESWIDHLNWAFTRPDQERFLKPLVRVLGGTVDDYRWIHDLMRSPTLPRFPRNSRLDPAPPDAHLLLLTHHSLAPFLVESLIGGSTWVRPSDQKRIPVRPLVEAYLLKVYDGKIPSLASFLATAKTEPWMCRGARALFTSPDPDAKERYYVPPVD